MKQMGQLGIAVDLICGMLGLDNTATVNDLIQTWTLYDELIQQYPSDGVNDRPLIDYWLVLNCYLGLIVKWNRLIVMSCDDPGQIPAPNVPHFNHFIASHSNIYQVFTIH